MIASNPIQTRQISGFTLIELIGVMAILAILSSVIAPNFFKAINDAYAEAEKENLQQLAEDFEHYVLTTKSIPSQTASAWSAALASISDYPEQDILDNQRGFSRVFYFDPQFFTSTDSSFTGYTQSTGLTSAPVSARVMIMSDMTGDLSNPGANSSTFDAIWNQDTGAAVIESTDVNILRLNISHLFKRVLLTNPNTSQTSYSLEDGSLSPVPAASGGTDGLLEIWVLDGTELRTYATPYPSGSLSTASLVNSFYSHIYVDESGS